MIVGASAHVPGPQFAHLNSLNLTCGIRCDNAYEGLRRVLNKYQLLLLLLILSLFYHLVISNTKERVCHKETISNYKPYLILCYWDKLYITGRKKQSSISFASFPSYLIYDKCPDFAAL